jgi:hypothetical protein
LSPTPPNRISLWLAIIAIVCSVIALVLLALSPDDAGAERTPLSCDGKKADFHAERAKTIADNMFDHKGSDSRILDASPDTREERRDHMRHRRCLADKHRRHRMQRYLHVQEDQFEAKFLTLTYPPGLAVLAARRACEQDPQQGYYTNTGNGYQNAYQFDAPTWAATGPTFKARTGLDPNPSRLALPREQDIRAAIADQQSSGDPWPHCP